MPDSTSPTSNSSATISLAERQYTGLLVALWLPADAAAELALPDAVPGEELHVTLCYCPDAGDWDDLRTARAIASVERSVAWRSMLDGRVGGYGRFMASETSDDQDVFYAAVDVPGLVELRGVVESALCEAQCPPSDVHGYTPHITLAYLDPTAANPVERLPAVDLHFAAVSVLVGDRRMDIPLSPPLAIYAIKDEKQEALHVYQAMQFADPPEWTPFLPVPGIYHHPIYGVLDYTSETYERMLANFKGGVYQERLPVNAEHDPHAAGAVGWIVDMRLAESGALEAKVEWNERGKALIEGDRYGYVSAEVMPWWTDPVDPNLVYQDVAVGMAITTHPYFKERVLPPLVASEAVLVRTAGDPGKEHEMTERSQSKEQKPVVASTEQDPPVQLSESEVQAFRQFMDAGGPRVLTELSEAKDRIATMEHSSLVKRFTDEVRGRSDENGVPWLGDVEGHVTHAVTLATTFGEESDEVKHYVMTNRAHAEQMKSAGLFATVGTGNGGDLSDTEAKIAAKVDEVRKSDPTLSREQAEAKVYSDNPDLYEAAMKGGA